MAHDSSNEKDLEYLRRAVQLARCSVDEGGGPFGAVVVRGDQIIAEGANRVTQSNDPTAHAEVVAIREACRNLKTFDLRGCTIYSSTEPCPMCLGAILWSRADRVVFATTRDHAAAAGFDDEHFYREINAPTHERTLPSHFVELDEAHDVFTAWKASDTKIEY